MRRSCVARLENNIFRREQEVIGCSDGLSIFNSKLLAAPNDAAIFSLMPCFRGSPSSTPAVRLVSGGVVETYSTAIVTYEFYFSGVAFKGDFEFSCETVVVSLNSNGSTTNTETIAFLYDISPVLNGIGYGSVRDLKDRTRYVWANTSPTGDYSTNSSVYSNSTQYSNAPRMEFKRVGSTFYHRVMSSSWVWSSYNTYSDSRIPSTVFLCFYAYKNETYISSSAGLKNFVLLSGDATYIRI